MVTKTLEVDFHIGTEGPIHLTLNLLRFDLQDSDISWLTAGFEIKNSPKLRLKMTPDRIWMVLEFWQGPDRIESLVFSHNLTDQEKKRGEVEFHIKLPPFDQYGFENRVERPDVRVRVAMKDKVPEA